MKACILGGDNRQAEDGQPGLPQGGHSRPVQAQEDQDQGNESAQLLDSGSSGYRHAQFSKVTVLVGNILHLA